MRKVKKEIMIAYDTLAKDYLIMRKNKTNVHFYKEFIEAPTLFKLLGDVKNKKILDLGCGPGVHAHQLTKRGAIVTGIDNSVNSIELAKAESCDSTFLVGDIEKLPFKPETFDIVLSALVLVHFKDWNEIFKEVRRVLKIDGIFVFSLNNPFNEIRIKEEWYGKKFKASNDYFKERMLRTQWAVGDKRCTISQHHKTYGTIIRYILNNKFEILDYEDCKPIAGAKKKFPKNIEKRWMPQISVYGK